MNLKHMLVNKIEETLEITLTKEQLTYIFNEDEKLIITAPRQYGKSLMQIIKIAVNSLLNPGHKIAVICPSKEQIIMTQQRVCDVFDLIAPNSVTHRTKSPCRISVCNDTEIRFFGNTNANVLDTELRGCRFNEAYIEEMYHITNLEFLVNRLEMARAPYKKHILNLVGTPVVSNNRFMERAINSECFTYLNIEVNNCEELSSLVN